MRLVGLTAVVQNAEDAEVPRTIGAKDKNMNITDRRSIQTPLQPSLMELPVNDRENQEHQNRNDSNSDHPIGSHPIRTR